MIRLATVGTSAIADRFAEACALTGRYTLAAVYSRDQARGVAFGQRHGCSRVYTDLAEMAGSGELDAVYIATPNVLHAAGSRLFLEQGIHVLCEKPITVNAKEYAALKALADRRGLVYMEALMARHVPHRNAVKAAAERLGRICMARIDFCQRSSRYDAFRRGEQVNIFDPSLHAGTLMDLGVYCVYGAVDLFGVPDGITATASILPGGADGSGCAVFTYPDFQAVLTYGKTGQSELGSEIIGDEGTLKIASISQYAGVTLLQGGIETELVGSFDKAEIMRGEAERFADFIARPAENAGDYAQASQLCAAVHGCMDRIKASANLVYP